MTAQRISGDDEGHQAGGGGGRGIPVAEVVDKVNAMLASGACRPGDRFPIVVEGRAIMVSIRGPRDCG